MEEEEDLKALAAVVSKVSALSEHASHIHHESSILGLTQVVWPCAMGTTWVS